MTREQAYIEFLLDNPSMKWVLIEFGKTLQFYSMYSTRAQAYYCKKRYEINGRIIKASDFVNMFGTQEQKEKYKEIHNV